MASENLKIDNNNKNVSGAITDDSSQFIKMLRIDDTTKGLKVSVVGGGGTGTVTSITQGTGILLTPSPITTTGSIALSVPIQPIATLGSALQSIRVNAGATALEYYTPAAGGITIGTTTITSGTTTRILYDNAGVVGEYTITGTGTVVAMQTSPSLLTSLLMDSGFVMNWASSNVVLTHTSGILTLGTGTLKIATPTNTTTSVVTIDGTQSLTNKTYNGNTFTAGTGVLTIAASKTLTANSTLTLAGTDGKTLTVSNSLTLAGTDSTVMTFPSTSATIARTDAANTFTGASTATSWVLTTPLLGTPTSGVLTNCTGLPAASVVAGTFGTGSYTIDTQLTVKQIVNTSNAITATSNAATVPITSRISTVTNNSAATLTITITTTSAVDGQMVMVRVLDFSGVAQTLAWVNTENSTVTAPVLTNGSTTLPLTVGFQYNNATSKWRCLASA